MWSHEPKKIRPRGVKKFSCSHPIEGWFLDFSQHVALYHVSQDFGRSVHYSERKEQVKCRAGGM